jgi:hypothetical protein
MFVLTAVKISILDKIWGLQGDKNFDFVNHIQDHGASQNRGPQLDN